MNSSITAQSDAKIQLSRNTLAKTLGGLLLVGVIALFFSILQFWFVFILIIFAILTDIWGSYFITPEFLQKGQRKLLFSDLQDIRRFLWWYILIDRFNDSIWIVPSFLTAESRNMLESRLGIQGIQAEQRAAANP